jgi:hypothetical protein
MRGESSEGSDAELIRAAGSEAAAAFGALYERHAPKVMRGVTGVSSGRHPT